MFELTRRNNGYPTNYYDPFREMEKLERSFFGAPFDGFFGGKDLGEFKTDITDEGDHYLLEADLPGFDKKDIHLDVNGDTLTIQAERHSKVEQKDNQDRIVRVERSYGSYSRSFDATGIDVEVEKLGDRPCAGAVDPARQQALLDRVSSSIRDVLGQEPCCCSGSTDCNIPLSLGIPAVCMGVCTGSGCHTREESLELDSLLPGSRLFLDFLADYFPTE